MAISLLGRVGTTFGLKRKNAAIPEESWETYMRELVTAADETWRLAQLHDAQPIVQTITLPREIEERLREHFRVHGAYFSHFPTHWAVLSGIPPLNGGYTTPQGLIAPKVVGVYIDASTPKPATIVGANLEPLLDYYAKLNAPLITTADTWGGEGKNVDVLEISVMDLERALNYPVAVNSDALTASPPRWGEHDAYWGAETSTQRWDRWILASKTDFVRFAAYKALVLGSTTDNVKQSLADWYVSQVKLAATCLNELPKGAFGLPVFPTSTLMQGQIVPPFQYEPMVRAVIALPTGKGEESVTREMYRFYQRMHGGPRSGVGLGRT